MAAVTPVLWSVAETIPQDRVYVPLKGPYSGADQQVEAEWQLSRTNSFPASATNKVWSSGLRENDNHSQGDDWVEIFMDLLLTTPGETLYLSCRVRNGLLEASGWATAIALTISSDGPTGARSLQAT